MSLKLSALTWSILTLFVLIQPGNSLEGDLCDSRSGCTCGDNKNKPKTCLFNQVCSIDQSKDKGKCEYAIAVTSWKKFGYCDKTDTCLCAHKDAKGTTQLVKVEPSGSCRLQETGELKAEAPVVLDTTTKTCQARYCVCKVPDDILNPKQWTTKSLLTGDNCRGLKNPSTKKFYADKVEAKRAGDLAYSEGDVCGVPPNHIINCKKNQLCGFEVKFSDSFEKIVFCADELPSDFKSIYLGSTLKYFKLSGQDRWQQSVACLPFETLVTEDKNTYCQGPDKPYYIRPEAVCANRVKGCVCQVPGKKNKECRMGEACIENSDGKLDCIRQFDLVECPGAKACQCTGTFGSKWNKDATFCSFEKKSPSYVDGNGNRNSFFTLRLSKLVDITMEALEHGLLSLEPFPQDKRSLAQATSTRI